MPISQLARKRKFLTGVSGFLQELYRKDRDAFQAFLWTYSHFTFKDAEAYFFDFDDTSYDTRDAVKSSYRKAFTAMGLQIPSEKILDSFIGPPLADNIQRWVRQNPPSFKTLEPYGVSPLRIPEQDLMVCDGWKDYISAVVDQFRAFQDPPNGDIMRCRAFPGMTNVWSEMRKAKKIVCIATSRPETSAEGIIQATGTRKYFHAIYGADKKSGKEKNLILYRAITDLGVDPNKAVNVDDHPLGMRGAILNGLASIGVCWGPRASRGVAFAQDPLLKLALAGATATVRYPSQIIDLMHGRKRMAARQFNRYMRQIEKLAA